MTTLPAPRSVLFVPANKERFVEKANTRGADAILLDLEDAVAPSEKEAARKALPAAVAKITSNGTPVGVRINRPLELVVRDIEAAVIPGVSWLSVTKVEGPLHVRLLSEVVATREAAMGIPHGTVKFSLAVETAAAWFDLHAIAKADPRAVSIGLGSEDFALSCGIEPTTEALLMPKQHVVIAARAAGILPMGFAGSIADFGDLDAFRAMVRRSRALGFVGASCIHPAQVAILNEEFGPRPEEVAYARRVIAENDAAAARGEGAFQLDGKMIDAPIVMRARNLLAWAARLGM